MRRARARCTTNPFHLYICTLSSHRIHQYLPACRAAFFLATELLPLAWLVRENLGLLGLASWGEQGGYPHPQPQPQPQPQLVAPVSQAAGAQAQRSQVVLRDSGTKLHHQS